MEYSFVCILVLAGIIYWTQSQSSKIEIFSNQTPYHFVYDAEKVGFSGLDFPAKDMQFIKNTSWPLQEELKPGKSYSGYDFMLTNYEEKDMYICQNNYFCNFGYDNESKVLYFNGKGELVFKGKILYISYDENNRLSINLLTGEARYDSFSGDKNATAVIYI